MTRKYTHSHLHCGSRNSNGCASCSGCDSHCAYCLSAQYFLSVDAPLSFFLESFWHPYLVVIVCGYGFLKALFSGNGWRLLQFVVTCGKCWPQICVVRVYTDMIHLSEVGQVIRWLSGMLWSAVTPGWHGQKKITKMFRFIIEFFS